MAQAWSDARSYRVSAQANQQGVQALYVMEVVKPDREHTTISLGSQTIEQIRIGPDTYLKAAGQWTKLSTSVPLPQVAAAAIDPAQLVQALGAAAQLGQTVTRGAVDTINGDQCQWWQIGDPDPTNSTKICIGFSDKLPRQMTVGRAQAVLTFSDWNSAINIEPPI